MNRVGLRRAAARATVGLLALALGWSCGDGVGGSEAPTLDELPDLLVEALCPELESCLGERVTQVYFGEAGCTERLHAQLEDGNFAATKAAVEAGSVRYDGSQVSACLAAFRGIGCGFETRRVFTSDACNAVLEGDVVLGEECALDEECKGAAFCRREGDRCPGTCTALLEAGEPCTTDDECADGLTCPGTTMRCVAPGHLGEPCGRVTDAPCTAGLVCVGSDTAGTRSGECSDPEELYAAQLGESCDLDNAVLCDEELACALIVPVGTTAEFKCMERVEVGDPCTFGAPSQCPEGSFCSGVELATRDFEGTCAELPDENDECNDSGGQQCADGLLCGPDGICRELGRLGDGCNSDATCASEHCDDGACARPAKCALASDE
jgi:hypothetical protein